MGNETARLIDVIWVRREGEYFCEWDWTGQISLIRLKNFRFARKSVRGPLCPAISKPDARLHEANHSSVAPMQRSAIPGHHKAGQIPAFAIAPLRANCIVNQRPVLSALVRLSLASRICAMFVGGRPVPDTEALSMFHRLSAARRSREMTPVVRWSSGHRNVSRAPAPPTKPGRPSPQRRSRI
jgi:hypothetical protein